MIGHRARVYKGTFPRVMWWWRCDCGDRDVCFMWVNAIRGATHHVAKDHRL